MMQFEKIVEQQSKKFNQIVKDIKNINQARQKLNEQHSECSLVKSEIDLLDASAVVYKLVGPILVTQSVDQSKMNVNKRVDWINGEIQRSDEKLKSREKELQNQRNKLMQLQQNFKRAMQKQ